MGNITLSRVVKGYFEPVGTDEFNSEAVFDLRGCLGAIAVAEAIAIVRGQNNMRTVFPCSKQVNGSYQIDLSTADL